MIFKSIIPDLLSISINEARKAGAEQRGHLREMLLDFYSNNQLAKDEYLLKWGFKGLNELPAVTSNLTQSVIDEISMLYKYAPDRYLTSESGEPLEKKDGYAEFCTDKVNADYHAAWDIAEKLRNLIKNVLFRFVYDEDKKILCFYIETDYIPHFKPGNPLKPVGYSIALKMDTNEKTQQVTTHYAYFSDDEYYIHDADGKHLNAGELEKFGYPDFGGVNPYGVMPIVDLSPFAYEEYWHVGEAPLVYANRMLNIAELNSFHGQHLQAFSQPYVTGVDEDDSTPISPAVKWNLPEGATAGTLDFNPRLLESAEYIEKWLSRQLDRYGLSANFTEQGDISSGIALRIKKGRILERRKKDINLFRIHEHNAYQIISKMVNYHNLPYDMPLDAQLMVDYVEPEFPTDKEDAWNDWERKWKYNLATLEDYLIEQNPDMSREDAEKMINENRAANSQFRSVFAAAQQPVEDEENAG